MDDNIRPPDDIVYEQLLEDNRTEFDMQIDEALHLSMQDIKLQRDINKKYENELIKVYQTETIRRTELFKEFMFNLHKISKFDKEVRDIYDILDPIIESYCGQFIETCELDRHTYETIFNTLKKIRNNQMVIDILKIIILSE